MNTCCKAFSSIRSSKGEFSTKEHPNQRAGLGLVRNFVASCEVQMNKYYPDFKGVKLNFPLCSFAFKIGVENKAFRNF